MNLTNNQKITLPSGAELEITMLPFQEGRNLYKAVCRALKAVHVDFNTDIKDLNALKDGFIEITTNKEVEDAVLQALKRCTYNNERILTWDFFDPLDKRQDYFEVCWEVVKFNLYPFASRLFAKLSALLNQSGPNQTSK